ncbi:unnamed protein product, partial [Staurois parvus]
KQPFTCPSVPWCVPAARFTSHPVFQKAGHLQCGFSHTGCDCLRLHNRVPTVHARVALSFMNGPVVFWDLSRVPKDYRKGGREDTFCF